MTHGPQASGGWECHCGLRFENYWELLDHEAECKPKNDKKLSSL